MRWLKDLMDMGFVIRINDFVEESHPIHIPASTQGFTDFVENSGRDVLVFHTKDYNYIAYPWPEAHERNMAIVYNDIERAAEKAEESLNKLVYAMRVRANKREANRRLVVFTPWYANEPYTNAEGQIQMDFSTAPLEEKD